MQDNLTSNLTDSQLKGNIDALMGANKSTVDVQKYVDNYAPDGKGGYTLKVPNQPAPAPEQQGLLSKLGDRVNAIGNDLTQTNADGSTYSSSNPVVRGAQSGVNVLGDIAGGIGDTIGAVLSPALKATGLDKPIGSAVSGVANSELGKTATDAYNSLSPEQQHAMDSIFNVGTTLLGGKAATSVADSGVGQVAKDAIVDTATGAKNLVKGTTPEGIADIISGPLGKADRTSILSDTGTTLNGTPQGVEKTLITGKVKPILTPEDKLQVIDVQPYVTGKNPITNITNLNKGATDIAQNIVQPHLDSITQPVNMETVSANLDKMKTPLSFKADPILEKTYQNAKDTFMGIAQKNDGTVSGLWDARKQFDKLIYKEYGSKAFDDPTKNAAFQAMSDVRNNINNFIADKSGNSTFKTAMQKLSNIYDARDNIALKNNSIVGTTRYGRVSKILKDNPIISTAGATAGAILGGEKLMGK